MLAWSTYFSTTGFPSTNRSPSCGRGNVTMSPIRAESSPCWRNNSSMSPVQTVGLMLPDDTETVSRTCVRTTTAATVTSTAAAAVTFQRTADSRRVGNGRVGRDRIVLVDDTALDHGPGRVRGQPHTELAHHVVVFVHQVVAVDHVLAHLDAERTAGVRGAELHDQPHLFQLARVDVVLRAQLPGERRFTVAAQHLEVDQVDVHRMEPAVRVVLDLPDLGIAESGIGDDVPVTGSDDLV